MQFTSFAKWLKNREERSASPGDSDEGIRKYYSAEKLDEVGLPQSRRLRFVISTQDVDRDNDTVNPAGWDLSNYRNNPVVLWAHDQRSLPIARAVEVGIEGNSLVAVAEFATHQFAETVYQMLKGGFLRAVSVGFAPLEYKINEERRGIDFMRQELLEFSVCPVPANPNALMAASASGLDLDPIRQWIGDMAKSWPGMLTLPAEAAEKVQPEPSEPAPKKDGSDEAIQAPLREQPKEQDMSALEAKLDELKAQMDTLMKALTQKPEKAEQQESGEATGSEGQPAGEGADKAAEGDDVLELSESANEDALVEIDDPVGDIARDMQVSEKELVECMQQVIREALAGVTQGVVQTAINQAKGRLD